MTYFQILEPPNISGKAEVTNLKFFMLNEHKGYKTKISKTSQKGALSRSCDLLFKFQDPQSISGMHVATNFKFGFRSDIRRPKQNIQNWVKNGCGIGHVIYI